MVLVTTLMQAAGEDGLTIGEVISDIPHDAAAFLVYALTAASLYLIWRGNRKSGARGGSTPAATDPTGAGGAAGPGDSDAGRGAAAQGAKRRR